MANLDAAADKAVHDAVDAFMEGRLTPEFAGETVFETRHSRYRLRDGVVFAAPDDSLVGAELVGWLMETSRRSVVGSAWQPGARAVLVNRHRGRNIIVTSTTRLLHLEEPASNEPVAQGALPPRPVPQPPFSPPWAPVIPATPPPPLAQSPASVQRRAAVHLPPRPITATPTPTPLPVPSRPLPLPVPPPRRDAPPAMSAESQNGGAWELSSSEFEIDQDTTTDEALSADAPIPLVRTLDPAPPYPRR